MIFPESLFRLNDIDKLKTFIEFVAIDKYWTTAAAVFDNEFYTVPLGFNLCIQSLYLDAEGGGAQTVSLIAINVLPAGTQAITLMGKEGGGIARVDLNLSVSPIILPPGTILKAFGSFSAGVAANFVEVDMSGFLIPKGTIVR